MSGFATGLPQGPGLAPGGQVNPVARLIARVKRLFSPGPDGHAGEPLSAPLLRPYPWEASYPPGLSWSLELEPRPLSAILDQAVAAFPTRTCLNFLAKRYTYREIGKLVDRAARGFQEIGVTKGVRVGLFLPNSPYYVICYHAVLKAGGTVVNFNPLYAEREIARQIGDSGTRIMVSMDLQSLYPKLAGRLEDTELEAVVVCRMSGALPFPGKAFFRFLKRKELAAVRFDARHIRFEKLIANDGVPAPVAIDPVSDVAVLQYTGGTTGTPKGAMLTHANLYANAVQTRLWGDRAADDGERILGVLPLFHVFGMTAVMNVGLLTGSEILLLPRFKTAEVFKVIDREKATMIFGVPTMYSAMNEFEERGDYDLSSLRFCCSGGAPLPVKIKETFERLAGCPLVEGYGLSEAAPTCTINPIDGPAKPGSAGLPVPGTVVEIVSLEDPERVLPLGQRGEVRVSGPQVMRGYWKQEAETAEVLRDGLLRTGDVGYMDAEGYLYLIDRIKDLIITGGFNVYPKMVEEAIRLHPAVADVAVCGIPNRHHGEIVKAYIVLKPEASLTAVELRLFLKDKLASFEIPRKVAFRSGIPKTILGKPLRRELIAEELARKRAAAGPARGKRGGALEELEAR